MLMPMLSGSQFKVLGAVIDKTAGWGKEREGDIISKSQFVTMTGLAPSTVDEALLALEEMNIIFAVKRQDENGEHLATHYTLHMRGSKTQSRDVKKRLTG